MKPRFLRTAPFLLVLALGLTLGGHCRAAAKKARAAKKAELTVLVPCVIGGPMQRVVAAYEARHPNVEVRVDTYKPLGAAAKLARPTVVVTLGDREMQALVRSGKAAQADCRTFALEKHRLLAIAPADKALKLQNVQDLADASVRRIFIEDPDRSSLGERARQLLQDLGLWGRIKRRVVHPRPGAMVLGDLIGGQADAAIVLESCLISEDGAIPKTVRLVGRLPEGAYPPIPIEAAALRSTQPKEAQDFVVFLISEAGERAVSAAGLDHGKSQR